MRGKRLSAVTAALLIAATGCEDSGAPDTIDELDIAPATETSSPGIESAAPAATTVRVADIVRDPATYNGREVTIEAAVDEVLGPRAFELDDDLIVLYRHSARLADLDDQWLNDRVRVTGTVRTVNIVDIEREVGWDLDPQIEVELEGMEPVLIARTVERINSGM